MRNWRRAIGNGQGAVGNGKQAMGKGFGAEKMVDREAVFAGVERVPRRKSPLKPVSTVDSEVERISVRSGN